MNERDGPSRLKDIDDRLRRLRSQESAKQRGRGATDPRGGIGFAVRIGVEIVAAIGVGTGIGLLLDRWLGTAPWLMVLFFMLGAAAGMLNVYRVMQGMDQSVGLGRATKEKDKGPDQEA